jgi:hypothetical protein
VQEGITINGLLLELREDKKKGWRNSPRHWRPGAFVISAYGMGNFDEALKRKLVLEILAGSDQARFR